MFCTIYTIICFGVIIPFLIYGILNQDDHIAILFNCQFTSDINNYRVKKIILGDGQVNYMAFGKTHKGEWVPLVNDKFFTKYPRTKYMLPHLCNTLYVSTYEDALRQCKSICNWYKRKCNDIHTEWCNDMDNYISNNDARRIFKNINFN